MIDNEEEIKKLQKKVEYYNIGFLIFVVIEVVLQVPLFDLGIDWSIDSRKPLGIVIFILLVLFGLFAIFCTLLSIKIQRKIQRLNKDYNGVNSQNNSVV